MGYEVKLLNIEFVTRSQFRYCLECITHRAFVPDDDSGNLKILLKQISWLTSGRLWGTCD